MPASEIKRDKERDGEAGEGSVAYVITKPVDIAELGKEIAEAAKLDSEMGISAQGVLKHASKESPITVWFHGDEVEMKTLTKVVAAHEFTLSELDKLMVKANAGEDLTDSELQAAVRSLLLRVR